jgi:RNA polymerase sigma factor (sigma-70 family)
VRPVGSTEELLRELAPQVLAALLRRYRDFDMCEDAVQEALLAAATRWPAGDLPADPKAWLITVASRRMVDRLRSERSRRRREDAVAAGGQRLVAPAADAGVGGAGTNGHDDDADGADDVLALLFLCCHPALSGASQLALTLRAVGGLTTAEIAQAFFVPETTMGQRISRAKQSIAAAGARFELPVDDREGRLAVVMHVLYLMFNEGHTASAGARLVRADLTTEAIRLTRAIHRRLPDDTELGGLLALMLLTDARRAARVDATGGLLPLAAQDRDRWDDDEIREGIDLITAALPSGPIGPYQLQAAIAAVHAEAPSTDETDWLQILGLYDILCRVSPNPMADLNRVVAYGEVNGAPAALRLLDDLATDPRLSEHHRTYTVRAHLLERTGDLATARTNYRAAARRTQSLPEQRFLEGRAARLLQ